MTIDPALLDVYALAIALPLDAAIAEAIFGWKRWRSVYVGGHDAVVLQPPGWEMKNGHVSLEDGGTFTEGHGRVKPGFVPAPYSFLTERGGLPAYSWVWNGAQQSSDRGGAMALRIWVLEPGHDSRPRAFFLALDAVLRHRGVDHRDAQPSPRLDLVLLLATPEDYCRATLLVWQAEALTCHETIKESVQ